MIRRFLKKTSPENNLKRFFSMSPNPKFFLLRFKIKSEEEKPRPGTKKLDKPNLKFPFRKHGQDDGGALRPSKAVRGEKDSPDCGQKSIRDRICHDLPVRK